MIKNVVKRLFRLIGFHIQGTEAFATTQQHLQMALQELRDQHAANQEARSKIGRLEAQIRNLNAQNEQLAHGIERYRDAYLALVEQLDQVRAINRGQPTPTRTVDRPSSIADDVRITHDAAHWTRLGDEEHAKGNRDGAIAHYGRAITLIYGYGPAREGMLRLSQEIFQDAEQLRNQGKLAEAKRTFVRVVELNPGDQAARTSLDEINSTINPPFDLTKQCLVHIDPDRGKRMYQDAFLRVYEYLASAGLLGEVLEFGVLNGCTARIQCQIMRDLLIWRQIHLFDSFEGLPDYDSPVDRDSYDVAVRNVWADKMRFSDDFVRDRLGVPIDAHIFNRLGDVISPERIHIYRGFFSETLQNLPSMKAALVHIDCDLYQSTREVLTALFDKDVFQDGCVVMFDDWNCFRANPHFGERRAFQEFLDSQKRFASSLFFTYGFNGAAFFLHDLTVGADQ